MNKSIKGIEQGRAETAYKFVKCVADKDADKDEFKKKYKSSVKKLPVLIKTNGLGQSVAFIKNRDGWEELYEQLSIWLKEKELILKDAQLIEEIIKMPSNEYRQLTVECIAFLNWMRRFADGLIDVEE